jgi:branched-chain amino acid transport system ATP-binding protein
MPVLEVRNLARNFDGVKAVDGINFDVDQGEFVSIIGPNGAGKTTLFNLITGTDQPTHGSITFEGQSLVGLRPDQFASRGIARTFQHGRVFGNLSVLDNVMVGAQTRRKASGEPFVILHGEGAKTAARMGITDLRLTLSHSDHYAVAHALALGE